ncbi:hypothetical protein ACOSP7_019249 [Xanthoceras sorbifolium]|uniref:ENTH domain-containing protein n=1 Tax=Xanthoceras sorbifolium TaxID=99658 RepID=A0ABQ8I2I3_9ROSI|nr:hypothetical protein JRO89_XS05G0195200 [Xanthoceras sorbifolium]
MKLWKRAAGILKDQNSIWVTSLSRQTTYRNPELETAIIKATSHDEFHVDYRNAQRVFTWIRTSPVSLKPLIWGLSKRMKKTKSWVVTLKGLILMHGVFCCKIPAVQKIGRLPFDLSNFHDGHLRPSNSWGFNNFVRCYYSFLDQRSAFLYEQSKPNVDPMVQDLVKLQEWQSLLDLLLQIKPRANNMKVALILEAMDCVIIEMYDVYSRICNGVARVLIRIYSAGKAEVSMALRVLQKATQQSEELSLYFEFCKEFGVLNMLDLPKVIQIPEEDIRDLERIINGVSESTNNTNGDGSKKNMLDGNEGAIVAIDDNLNRALKTIITDKWEIFEEDFSNQFVDNKKEIVEARNPFLDSPNLLPLVPVTVPPAYNHVLPDLISF